jgi:hypothetical protein
MQGAELHAHGLLAAEFEGFNDFSAERIAELGDIGCC